MPAPTLHTPRLVLRQRLGFQQDGHLRGEWETHIGVRDSLIFGLLRDEWTMETMP
jgi:[ribosomal protein S5]-alanine N-acetyltransferase